MRTRRLLTTTAGLLTTLAGGTQIGMAESALATATGSERPAAVAPAGAIYVAIAYASYDQLDRESATILGLVGVYESTVQGAIWGMAFGPTAGILAGLTMGV